MKLYRTLVYCMILTAFCAIADRGMAKNGNVVFLHPQDNVQAAVEANPEGTTFNLVPGIYRLQKVSPKGPCKISID